MTVDIRCEIFCRFGAIVSGGISDDHVQGNWLIKTKGTLIIDRVFTPKKGQIVEMAYRRGNKVAPFPRFLTVLSSTSDPYRRVTTVEVGCPLTLLESRRERRAVQAEADPNEPVKAPQPVLAEQVLQVCVSRLGIQLTDTHEPLQHRYLWDEFDLSEGYVSVIQKLIESEGCYGHITRAGKLRIRKLDLREPEPGPLFTWQDLAQIEHMPGAKMPPDRVEVAFNGREAPGAAGDDWYPVADDGLGSFEDWQDTLSSLPVYGDGGFPGDGTDPPTEDNFRYWELDRTMGTPDSIVIQYTNSEGEPSAVSFTYLPYSESRTEYDQFFVWDSAQGRNKAREYVTKRTSYTNSMLAAVNGAYVKWALENGGGVPSATVWNTSKTTYTYGDLNADGPGVIIETTEETISGPQFAGSLGITDYNGVPLPGGSVLASRTVTKTYNNISGGGSKTVVSRWLAWGLTQEGSQVAASIAQDGTPESINLMIDNMKVLIMDGTETRTSSSGARPSTGLGGGPSQSGRQFPQTRPTRQEILADEIDPRGNSQKLINKTYDFGNDTAAVWESPMDDSEDAVTMRVSPPLSPDDWFSGNPGGGTTLQRGGATRAAAEYGEAVMQIEAGAAWGLAIMGDPWRFPNRPLKPIFIQHGGTTNCYRLTGMSWAISNNGMAVGSDSLLCGAVASAGGG